MEEHELIIVDLGYYKKYVSFLFHIFFDIRFFY